MLCGKGLVYLTRFLLNGFIFRRFAIHFMFVARIIAYLKNPVRFI